MTKKYIKFSDYLVEKLRDPIQASAFLDVAISEYEDDNDSAALMLALRYLVEAQGGIPKLSEKTKLNRQNLYKVLTGKTEPGLHTIMSIIKGLGFHLSPKPVATSFEVKNEVRS